MHSPCPKILHTGVSIAVLSENIVFVALNVIVNSPRDLLNHWLVKMKESGKLRRIINNYKKVIDLNCENMIMNKKEPPPN